MMVSSFATYNKTILSSFEHAHNANGQSAIIIISYRSRDFEQSDYVVVRVCVFKFSPKCTS